MKYTDGITELRSFYLKAISPGLLAPWSMDKEREINMFCVFHNVVFFPRLVKRMNLTHSSLNIQSG